MGRGGRGGAHGYRGGERFLMASTAKLPAVAAVLDRATADPALLDRVVRYGPETGKRYANGQGKQGGVYVAVRQL